MKTKAVLYKSIQEKKDHIEARLSPHNAIEHTLNLMDFYAQLAAQNPNFPERSSHNVPDAMWTELHPH